MSTIANLAVILDAKVGGFVTEMDKADKAFTKQSKAWDAMAGNAISTGAGLTASITAPILGMVAAAAAAGDAVQGAMNTIRVGTGATGPALEAMRVSFETVAAQVPNSLASVGTAVADLNTRLGLTGAPLESLAVQMLNLARITGTDVGEAIRVGTRVLGDWGVSAEGASTTMDFLFKVAQTTGITFAQLGQQLVTFGAPLRQMGFDFETSAALLGKFEREGVNAELVMGSLRIGLARMAKEGVTDAQAALQQLVTEIQSTEDPAKRVQLAMELFGAKAGPDMAAAIFEGRFAIENLVGQISGSTETINSAAGDAQSFGEAWGTVKNALTLALAPLGTAMVQAVQTLQPYLVGAAEVLGNVVTWFTNLPAPVIGAVAAITGLAVAIGPALLALGGIITAVTTIMGALAPLAAALGVGVTAMLGWAAAIAAAVAALVALGVWVYDNWESIQATVFQAWDGLVELWTATWDAVSGVVVGAWNWLDEMSFGVLGAVASFLGAVWDATVTNWINAWNLLSSTVVGIWNGILTVAKTVWGAITDTIGSFFTWAKNNIPGMDKILTLDKAWDGAKNLEAAHKSLATEIKATETTVRNVTPPVRTATTALDTLRTSVDSTTKSKRAMADEAKEVAKQVEATRKELDELATAMSVQVKVNELATAASTLNTALVQQAADLRSVSTTEIPLFVAEALNASSGIVGLTGKLPEFSTAAGLEFTTAKAALTGWGDEVAAEGTAFKAAFTDKITAAITSPIDGVMGAFADLATGDINSLADLGKRFADLGTSVLTNFRDVAVDAIMGPEGLITAALQPLNDYLGNLASKAASALGFSLPGAGGLPGVGGSTSGGGSTPGGAGGAGNAVGGGVSGVVGAVTGVISAVSDVFGNIQQAQALTKMTLIEENTRWLKRGLVELPDSLMYTTHEMRDILKTFTSAVVVWPISTMNDRLAMLEDYLETVEFALDNSAALIPTALKEIATNTKTIADQAVQNLARIFTEINAMNINMVLGFAELKRDENVTFTFNITLPGGETVTTTQTAVINRSVRFGFS